MVKHTLLLGVLAAALMAGAIDLYERVLVERVAKNIVVVADAEARAAEARERAASAPIVPAYIRIPSIGVAASVQHVGIASSGNLAVPTNYSDVGWYRAGSKPGSAGSAVFDGHFDNGLGLPAVFAKLKDLSPGDTIIIGNSEYETQEFVVTKTAFYEPTADSEDVFRENGSAGVALITCDGIWDPETESYNRRFVVFAEVRR